MIIWRTTIVAFLLATCLAIAPAGHALADDPGGQEVRQIAESLACPICEGQSVAESNSQLAQNMREVIRKKVEAGEAREKIMAYFVDRYGEGILLAPPRTGFNQMLWWLPALGLVLGAGLTALILNRWKASRRSSEPSETGLKEMTGEERERYEKRLRQEIGPES